MTQKRTPSFSRLSRGFYTALSGARPAPHPPVVGGQVAGRDREALPGDDEGQQPALGQVARGLGQEGVLRPLVFRVV